MMSNLTLNNCLGITEIVMPLSPLWGQPTPTLPSQNKILPLARLHPLKKPLFAVVASRGITMGVNDNRGRLYQPLGSIPRLSNSRLNKRLIHPDLLSSPSIFIAIAKRSDKSASNLSCTTWRSFWLSLVDIVTSQMLIYLKIDIVHQCITLIKTKPRSASTLTGLLTNNVMRSYDMAIYKSTLTHPKFTYLFLAVRRADVTAKPERAKVTANSEREARLMLVAEYVLFFAGRLPIRGQA